MGCDAGAPSYYRYTSRPTILSARTSGAGAYAIVTTGILYDPFEFDCVVSGSDIIVPSETSLAYFSSHDAHAERLFVDDALSNLVPVRGAGAVAITTRTFDSSFRTPDDTAFVLAVGRDVTTVRWVDVYSPEERAENVDNFESVTQAVGDPAHGRVVFVDPVRGLRYYDAGSFGGLGELPERAVIASLGEASVAIAYPTVGGIAVERRSLPGGTVVGDVLTYRVAEAGPRLFLRAANGDPLDGFRVFVRSIVGVRVLEVRESAITLVARLRDSVEAFTDSGEVLYVEDEAHRLLRTDGSLGELAPVSSPCEGVPPHDAPEACGGAIGCVASFGVRGDGQGGAVAFSYRARYPNSTRFQTASVEVSPYEPPEPRDPIGVRVVAIVRDDDGFFADATFGTRRPGDVEVTTLLESVRDGVPSARVSVPAIGGPLDDGAHLVVQSALGAVLDVTHTFEPETTKATLVVWRAPDGTMGHAVWEELPVTGQLSVQSVNIQTAAHSSSNGLVRAMDLRCVPTFCAAPTCTLHGPGGRLLYSGDFTDPELVSLEVGFSLSQSQPTSACETSPFGPTRTFTASDLGGAFLAIVDASWDAVPTISWLVAGD